MLKFKIDVQIMLNLPEREHSFLFWLSLEKAARVKLIAP